MNNKKIMSLVLSVLMVLPATVYAKGNKESDNKEKGNSIVQFVDKMQKDLNSYIQHKNGNNSDSEDKNQEANKENKDAKKQEIEQFKTQMKAKHEQMDALRLQINDQKKQVEQKKAQLKSIVNDLLSGKKTLPDDMLQSLITTSESLKKDAEQINATAEIKNEINDTQEKVNKKDFNNALASMDKVIARLQQRLDALKQLNADLDKVLTIANNAAAPSTTTDQTNNNAATSTDSSTTPAPSTTTTDSSSTQTAAN